jgi:two-component system LytT family response regulator
MTLKTLIVDDEPIARQILREELESMPNVQIVGEADNGPEALAQIQRHRPDLVLLDLQMPLMGGLEVVRNLQQGPHMPVVVIVTAFDNYAIQAFEAGAIDYLLKPVGQQRLTQAVERAKRVTGRQAAENLARLQEIAEPASSNSTLDKPSSGDRVRKVVGKIGEEYFLLSTADISAFQAEGDTVWIVAGKRKYIATQTLKALEDRLKNTSFHRIHRNALVNLEHIQKMSALSSQRWLITLNDNREFIASKRQARTVRELLLGTRPSDGV